MIWVFSHRVINNLTISRKKIWRKYFCTIEVRRKWEIEGLRTNSKQIYLYSGRKLNFDSVETFSRFTIGKYSWCTATTTTISHHVYSPSSDHSLRPVLFFIPISPVLAARENFFEGNNLYRTHISSSSFSFHFAFCFELVFVFVWFLRSEMLIHYLWQYNIAYNICSS